MPTTINVPERGNIDVDAETWRVLVADPETTGLIERKILGASYVSGGRVRLQGLCHVGRATLAGRSVEVVEKIPGALASLLSFATHKSFRVEKVEAPAAELGALFALLAEQYVDAVYDYVSMGRQRRYATLRSSGSLVSGRLRIADTIRLRARGQFHKVAFEQPYISGVTDLNRVISAALREINRLAAVVDLPHGLLASARGLSILFSDCRDSQLLFGRLAVFVALAERLEADPQHSQFTDLLALARVILEHASFDPLQSSGSSIPRSWFINLELLFEDAVREVMRELAPPGWSVFKPAKKDAPRIFDNEANYHATPDLVLASGGEPRVVGDVKYKEFDDRPGESDVYQLLVHTSAFKAAKCFLVYPGAGFAVRELGMSATGQPTLSVVVDVRDLHSSLKQAWAILGP